MSWQIQPETERSSVFQISKINEYIQHVSRTTDCLTSQLAICGKDMYSIYAHAHTLLLVAVAATTR